MRWAREFFHNFSQWRTCRLKRGVNLHHQRNLWRYYEQLMRNAKYRRLDERFFCCVIVKFLWNLTPLKFGVMGSNNVGVVENPRWNVQSSSQNPVLVHFEQNCSACCLCWASQSRTKQGTIEPMRPDGVRNVQSGNGPPNAMSLNSHKLTSWLFLGGNKVKNIQLSFRYFNRIWWMKTCA